MGYEGENVDRWEDKKVNMYDDEQQLQEDGVYEGDDDQKVWDDGEHVHADNDKKEN